MGPENALSQTDVSAIVGKDQASTVLPDRDVAKLPNQP